MGLPPQVSSANEPIQPQFERFSNVVKVSLRVGRLRAWALRVRRSWNSVD